jgi:omega-6 fatty acid desaturase (delta-12 desaturase)
MEAATPVVDVPADSSDSKPKSKAWWVEPLEPYAGADMRRSLVCLATSVLPYLALWPVMYVLLDVSYLLTLLVALPASGFLLRTYIVFHDCTHGSFMPTKRGNTWVGRFVALIVYSPFHSWRLEHAGHHATSGDLDRRGVGDVDTWTVAEYYSKPWYARAGYRLIRNPLIMLTLGPIWALALEPRIVPFGKRQRVRNSHLCTNLGLAVLVGALVWLVGWRALLEIQLPMIIMAGGAGVWLFYVQHQFDDVYWVHSDEWSFLDAALQGSSYLKLPKVLQFFTGNIGLHHIHHLSPRIPNYNLQRAHDANEFLHRAPTISLWQGLLALRLKLVDEDSGRLVTFGEARQVRRAIPLPTVQPADQPMA